MGMNLRYDDQGLIPAIVQHARSGEVLMLGYMNAQSLEKTTITGLVTFWSRSRRELWQKGATSGNVLHLVELRPDCDGDALLVLVEPAGPTCHTGSRSCFSTTLTGATATPAPASAILTQLTDLIARRQAEQTEDSYTVKLLNSGVDRIAKKVGEEATEVVIGAMKGDHAELRYELADLIYHTWVLLAQQGLPIEEVWNELERRYSS
ncbi:MAG: bifunctional phosphoribosyl-AMP cyclohydrolase/phosphoribosyl-ATP diphosphatase HisIE [Herpetosiphonaceae bacterium]|nr:bifunctional phosphoribosyl-AMP cyclohydrolase/phosphoribosyl-ATP diphosphatase HisIE [Herpetosiphonaceae bacterium]